MGLFIAEQSPVHAVQSAIAMQQALEAYNQSKSFPSLPDIQIGIGLNTGDVMLGALGSANRLSSTVIGDHVNLASRLQELTKRYHARILISHYVYQQIQPDQYCLREIDTVKIRGRSKPVLIYEVFDADPPEIKERKLKSREFLHQGIVLYKCQYFPAALEQFQQCLEIFPQDGVVFEYIARCHYFQKFPPPDVFWEGFVEDPSRLFGYLNRKRIKRHLLKAEAWVYQAFRDRSHIQRLATPLAANFCNISATGMQLELGYPLQIGDTAMIIICFRDTPFEALLGGETYHLLGRVVWQAPDLTAEPDPVWNIGFEIVVMQLEQEPVFQRALE